MEPLTLTPELFGRFSTLLGTVAGLQFEPGRLGSLQGHLRDRVQALQLRGFEQYYALLTDPPAGRDELRLLLETVTIHETSFFRNHEHFRALREVVLPALAARNAGERRLRLWSAGCATGEEAYSLAITCLEQPELAGWTITIEATDLSERALAVARSATYRRGALRYVELDRLSRWFTPQPAVPPPPGVRAPTTDSLDLLGVRESFTLHDRVRELVSFRALNLAAPHYPPFYAGFDLICCENVLIYLRPEIIRRTVEQFYERLRPGAFLFLGYSETLWQISDRFRLITRPNTFFYQRPEVEPPPAVPAAPAGPAAPGVDAMVRRLQRPALLGEPPRTAPLPGRPTTKPFSTYPLPPTTRPFQRSDQPSATSHQPPATGDLSSQQPAPPRPHSALSTQHSALGTAPDAALALTAATEYTRQGCAHLEAGQYPEAQGAFDAALARNPSAVDALVGLAQIHANQGRLGEAEAACARALAIDALCEEAHLLSAIACRLQGRTDAAIAHFEKLLYVNFESVAGHFHLAELYRAQGRATEAARHYRRALWALDRQPGTDTVGGLPATMVRRACEQQLRRYADAPPAG